MNLDPSPTGAACRSGRGERPEAGTVEAGRGEPATPPTVDSPPALQSTPPEPATMPEAPEGVQPPGAFVLPGFEIIGEIARGGMGVVYKARQRSLDRLVALKCLPPVFHDDPDRLRRFQDEAKVAAKLTQHGIVPVYDVLDATGTPVVVMPYIAGSDLGRILVDRTAARRKPAVAASQHPWSALPEAEFQERVLGLLDRVMDALTRLHQADVLHRDIKPSNILVDAPGDGWLTDFGLARFGTQLGGRAGTVGTPGYMSPEQWDGGTDIDGRADVFSLGVTAYQALTLELPYERKRVLPTTPVPPPPSRRNPLVTAELDTVISNALHPDRAARYSSASELKEAWDQARRPREPPSWWRRASGRRRAAVVAGIFAVVLLVAGGLTWGFMPRPVMEMVAVTTEPAGAQVVFVPLNPDTGEPDPERAIYSPPKQPTPLTMKLAPGPYFVEVATADGRFHQVYRQVPQPGQTPMVDFPHRTWQWRDDGAVDLPVIKIPPLNVVGIMARFEGAPEFLLGAEEPAEASPLHVHPVKPFFLDTHEVSEGAFRTIYENLPHTLQTPYGDNSAVTKVSYDMAMKCAEKMGKRLPTEAEYEFAATLGGTRKFPWGNDKEFIRDWPFPVVGQPDFDRTPTNPPVTGLYSNVAEWTTTWHMHYPTNLQLPYIEDYRSTRVIRGGDWSVVTRNPKEKGYLIGPRYRMGLSIERTMPGLGFRCARSVQPLFLRP